MSTSILVILISEFLCTFALRTPAGNFGHKRTRDFSLSRNIGKNLGMVASVLLEVDLLDMTEE